LKQQAEDGARLAVLEIPLLYETGGDKRVDVVIVVSAPLDIQRQRVLERPGMDLQKLEQVLARQLPDSEKRARADFVVDTGGTFEASNAQIDRIVESLKGRTGTAFTTYWT
jgi:dephospho-CoA kinase